MSDTYYTLKYNGRVFHSSNNHKTIRQVCRSLRQLEKNGYLDRGSSVMIEQHEGWELIEKAEYERLKAKYGDSND